ncbi:hypothetical protein BH20ACI2_BH20ACI2_03010 [soil metagenome]
MRAPKTIDFCKNEDCPSSNELLEFQVGELSKRRSGEVRKHLSTCEFCEAEVAFYTHYPQEELQTEPAGDNKIPAPLFELAEALLRNRNGDHRSLNSLLNENLVIDKV